MSFKHNEKQRRWEAHIKLDGRRVLLQIDLGYPESQLMDVANEAVAKVRKNWTRIQENITDSLLDIYNDSWSDPDDDDLPELSSAAFLKKIDLAIIEVMEERAITLWFSDSDLFGGHAIEVFWTDDDKMYEATLSG